MIGFLLGFCLGYSAHYYSKYLNILLAMCKVRPTGRPPKLDLNRILLKAAINTKNIESVKNLMKTTSTRGYLLLDTSDEIYKLLLSQNSLEERTEFHKERIRNHKKPLGTFPGSITYYYSVHYDFQRCKPYLDICNRETEIVYAKEFGNDLIVEFIKKN